jgi:hypothetical protein
MLIFPLLKAHVIRVIVKHYVRDKQDSQNHPQAFRTGQDEQRKRFIL